MFGSLKQKLISVGKNVKLFSDNKPVDEAPKVDVNLNAGAEILSYFAEQWEKIHELNENNAGNSEKIAQVIEDMYKKINNDYRNVTDICYLLSSGTQNLSDSVANCLSQLETLSRSIVQVEDDLMEFENLIEKLDLQEKELEHRFQLALYKEKKLANLEALRVELAEKHVQSVTEYERKQQQTLQERQKVFQEAFQNDLQHYKETGTLPKIEKEINSNGPTLEEIQLDCDSSDTDVFLSDI